MTDVVELIEKATAKGTFSVLDAVQGKGYPSDDVTVFTDLVSAYHLQVLAAQAAGEEDPNVVDEISAQMDELKAKVKDSALTFYLRGFAPGVVTAINDEARAKFNVESTGTGESAEWCNLKYLAESIIRVEQPDGSVDEHLWKPEEIQTLKNVLPSSEFDKIVELMGVLVFSSSLFDGVVSADF
jgi:hypothetical protein